MHLLSMWWNQSVRWGEDREVTSRDMDSENEPLHWSIKTEMLISNGAVNERLIGLNKCGMRVGVNPSTRIAHQDRSLRFLQVIVKQLYCESHHIVDAWLLKVILPVAIKCLTSAGNQTRKCPGVFSDVSRIDGPHGWLESSSSQFTIITHQTHMQHTYLLLFSF